MRKTLTCLFGLVLLASVFTIGCEDINNPQPPLTGSITIDPEPDDIEAPWQITGPGGFNRSGTGDMTFEDVALGDYELTWGEVSGWNEPTSDAVTLTLIADEVLLFSGTYIDRFPFPDTAEKLMTNFRNAYGSMDVDEYRSAMHAQYIFIFADGSPVAPTEGIYTREEDLRSTTRMFNGEQGQDLDGQPMPGVRDIEFAELQRLTNWENVPETDPFFPGAIRALFDVRVVFYLDTEDLNVITVDSQQLFFLESVSEEQGGGGTRQHFYLIGQQDLDVLLTGNENFSWGAVKVLYR